MMKDLPFVLKITTLFTVLCLAVINPKLHLANVKESKRPLSHDYKSAHKKLHKIL